MSFSSTCPLGMRYMCIQSADHNSYRCLRHSQVSSCSTVRILNTRKHNRYSLLKKWNTKLVMQAWKLASANGWQLLDARCAIQWERVVDIYRLSQLCLEQIVAAIGLVCSTIHLPLTHPCMCKYVYAFIACSLFPVASCILTSLCNLLSWQRLSVWSSF